MMILLLDRFSVRVAPRPFICTSLSSSSSKTDSPISTPLNHPSPNSYGFARGDPLTLSMLSSFLGSRMPVVVSSARGYIGVLGIKDGLNVEVDGTRLCCVVLVSFVGCLRGEVGRDSE